MKTTTKRVVGIVSVLAVTNWLALAADTTGDAPTQGQGSYNQVNQAQQSQANGSQPGNENTGGIYNNNTPMATQAPPEEYNKASGLIGMDVENQQGDHLGHIKDVVIDLKTERVSYAVMTTASKAFPVNEKLLAVPLNAFTVSADQKKLVLNADKAKVDSAQGFASKDWPNVGSPSWGAQPFWQNNNGSAPGQNTQAPRQNQ
jgi:sporulation protein YlmC with PRC-barrel domain